MKYLFFAVALFTGPFLFGQNPLKKYLVTYNNSIFHERAIIFNTKFQEDKRIREALVDTKILTEAQLKTALTFAQLPAYPEALNSTEKIINIDPYQRNKYKAYWIGSWTEFFSNLNDFRQMHLVWVPKEDNLTLDKEYIPKTDEGFYIICRSISTDNLPFFPVSAPIVKSIVNKLDEKKLYPAEKITDLYNQIRTTYGRSMGKFYSELKSKYNFTDNEIEAISRSTAVEGWPDSLKVVSSMQSSIPKINEYNFFKIGEIPGEYGGFGLFWVAPNQTFKNGFSPKSGLGFFFVAQINNTKTPGKPDNEDLAYLNSPWWFKNISSTDSYTPSTFSFASVAYIKNNVSNNTTGLNNQSAAIKEKIDAGIFPNGDSTKPNEGSVQHRIRRITYMGEFNVWATVDLNKETEVKKTLKDKYNYTDKDCEIIGRLANENGYPKALRQYTDRNLNSLMALNFTCYEVAEVTTKNASYALLWVPLKENAGLPDGVRPETVDGFYMFSYKNGLSKMKVGSYSGEVQYSGVSTTTVNGVTVATAKLERMDYKSGAIILYFGESRVVKNTSIYIVKFNKNNTNEESLANELRSGIAGVHPYMYFEFKEGYDCTSAQKYLRKKGIDPWSCLYITR